MFGVARISGDTKPYSEFLQDCVNMQYDTAQFFFPLKPITSMNKLEKSKFGKDLNNIKRIINTSEIKVYVHAPYNISVSLLYTANYTRHIFRSALKLCDISHVTGYNIHIGSTNRIDNDHIDSEIIKMANTLGDQIIKSKSKHVQIIIENMANGFTIDQIILLYNNIPNKIVHRVSLCIDTAHLWGMGYGLNSIDDVINLYELLGKFTGLIHLNGSPVKYGSHIDRHASVFDSEIPNEIMIKFVKLFINTPMILETKPYDTRNDDINRLKEISNQLE